MGTWILETDKAIYWMQNQYYIDKVNKTPASSGGYEVVVSTMKEWFTSDNPPGMMKIIKGSSEPAHQPAVTPDPSHGSGHPAKPTVKWIASVNFNSRNGRDIDSIVMHNTESSLQSAINRFQDPDAQVSAHYIVARSGDIIQMVKDSDRAWHAGDRDMNSRSIGIEHEATPANRGLTPAQEQATINLVKYLMSSYDVSLANIKPHRDVDTIAGGTDCPFLIWPTDRDFQQWKQAKLA
jgi:N-acetylmuramoyl-L-alanine amidase